jgi:hypothetical protein
LIQQCTAGAPVGSAFSRSFDRERRSGSNCSREQARTLASAGLAALRLGGLCGVVVAVRGFLRNGGCVGIGMCAVVRVHEFAESQSGHQQYRHRPAIEVSTLHGVQGSRR